MSIGFLTDEQTPMIWRGPMVTSAIKTFTQKVDWKNLDFIIVDMPPGTGDTQLTFAQEIKFRWSNNYFYTSRNSSSRCEREVLECLINLAQKLLDLIDNMSHFIGDDGKKYNIFGSGGVEKTAKEFNKKVSRRNTN